MIDFLHWNADLLPPQSTPFDPRPFTRTGGRSLGGIQRVTRTDRGYWVGSVNGILFRRARQSDQVREWTRLRTDLNGQTGLVAVPVCSTRYWAERGRDMSAGHLPHSDGTTFSDGTTYYEGRTLIEMAEDVALGATVVNLRMIDAPTAQGVRFSYQHALYETGSVIEQLDTDVFKVPVFPAVRQAIPAGAWLEADRPTLLCRLASDTEMDIEFPAGGMPRPSVNFVEAVDVWNDLAREAVD